MNNQEPMYTSIIYMNLRKKTKVKEQLTNLRDFDSRLTLERRENTWFSEKNNC